MAPAPADSASVPVPVPVSDRTRTDTPDAGRGREAPPPEVEVWRLDCTRHRDAGARFDSALDAGERARLRTMRRAAARLHFSAGRWLVRHALARRSGGGGSGGPGFELTIDARGRPSVVSGGVDFNLSHAGSFVVLALSAARVGIDVETTGRSTDWRAIARRFFSATERAALEARAEAERRAAFFRIWVRKEAFVKALGTGVATGFDRFDVGAGPEPALLDARIDGVDPGEWTIRDFDPGPGHFGAVAVRATRPRLRVHDAEP